MSEPGPELNQSLVAGLYIVATPIGNLSDISRRAVDILTQADVVACEDSRVTGKLLHHLGLKKRMIPYHDHSADSERQRLVDMMATQVVALVSDAGTPLISDPGYRLVRDAREAGRFITSIAGPSAAIVALTLSGLPTDRFLFAGFLPAKSGPRQRELMGLASISATLVFYESGPRLLASLIDMAMVLGDREAAVVREISKRFEEVMTGTLDQLVTRYLAQQPKGEIVVIVGPPVEQPVELSGAEIDTALRSAMAAMPVAKAAGQVAKAYSLDRKTLYARAVALKADT